MPHKPVKICGITRREDAIAATRAGAEAIGLVFYAPSPRAVSIEQANNITQGLQPWSMIVGLFVNEQAHIVQKTLDLTPINLLQFHGDEDAGYCEQFNRPYIKAVRVQKAQDIIDACKAHPGARAILLDAFVQGLRGGAGQAFDWSMIPEVSDKPLILAGGLGIDNVFDANRIPGIAALDVSSGVEAEKGIKDAAKINAFFARLTHEQAD